MILVKSFKNILLSSTCNSFKHSKKLEFGILDLKFSTKPFSLNKITELFGATIYDIISNKLTDSCSINSI